MFKCMPFLCNRHVDYVNKSNCNLSSVPDEVLRYGRTLEELLLDSNQIKDLPKVGTLRIMLGSWRNYRHYGPKTPDPGYFGTSLVGPNCLDRSALASKCPKDSSDLSAELSLV